MKLSDLFNPPKLTIVPIGECKCGQPATVSSTILVEDPAKRVTEKFCQKCLEENMEFERVQKRGLTKEI